MTILGMKMKIYQIKKQVFVFSPMKVCQPFSGGQTFPQMDNCFCCQPVFGKRTLILNSTTVLYFIERIFLIAHPM